MMKYRLLICTIGCGILFSTLAAGKSLGEFSFNQEQQQNRYYPQFKTWAAQDAVADYGEDFVLCIGSSSMRMWKGIHKDLTPLNIIHRGFGGSTMAQVRVWENFFVRYQADTVLIYEGDNDLAPPESSPASFIHECRLFCEALFRSNPTTKVYFISIKPSVAREAAWPRMQQGNELLKAYAEATPGIFFIDASNAMLDASGMARRDILLSDKLHMNKEGYKIWTAAVREALILDRSSR